MLARLTAITDLAGLRVVCLLALARGMAGDAVGVGVVGAMVVAAGATDVVAMATPVVAMVTGAAAMVMVAGSLADADLHAVQLLAASTVRLAAGFTAELWPMAVEGSTVAAGSTVVVVDTAAADTGNRGGSEFPDPAAKDERRMAGSRRCRPFSFSPKTCPAEGGLPAGFGWLWLGAVQ